MKLLAGGGLALACGLSAFLPLLVLSVAGVGNKIKLYAPFDFLASWPAVGILAILVGFDIFADKMTTFQATNRNLSQITRPLAGGLACAAVVPSDLLFPAISFVIGMVLAGAMHLMKSNLRPAFSQSSPTARMFEPLISIGEDGLSAVLAVISLLVPVIGAPLGLLVLGGGWWWQTNLRRKQRQVVQN